ncbi:hypothetical protein J2S00_001012 [Caldalkalibacillus uzonensis]|uniref:Uncharacterized protein n=1 Tax=Caldalkalibacillus uzonensis TaxID=353224 RepID=A0ABU0CP91_9BACI|nr:hypothetical protein [Caldalkalibacillus uzonensis]MDQ0338228.1 hypothetical protein [Caldalkalibacillus uzonensis]
MDVTIEMKNTVENQHLARQIRSLNEDLENQIYIRFNENVTKIILEGNMIYIPDKKSLPQDSRITGVLRKKNRHYILKPKEKSKTVNLHLDSELVEELTRIRQHVRNKTQHEILLELFKKGLEQYHHEHASEASVDNNKKKQ